MPSAGVATQTLSPVDGPRSPHSPTCSILIYLPHPNSPCCTVLGSYPIASVKLNFQSCKGFFVKKQRLVFDGNDCLVRVSDGKFLHLVLRHSDLLSITVETACGMRFRLKVEPCRNVRYVKKQIPEIGDQKLICDGEELEDRRLISDFCNKDEAIIHLLLCKSAKIRAKPVNKDKELSLLAPPETRETPSAQSLQLIASKQHKSGSLICPVIVNPRVRLSSVVQVLLRATSAGLEKGFPPVMSSQGSGGAYFMQDESGGKYVSVFKPIDEEPMAENNPRGLPLSLDGEGLKRGTRVREGALREVAAYLLDHPIDGRHGSNLCGEVGFSGVPPTAMVRCFHHSFNDPKGYECGTGEFKIGSLQMFVKNYGSCEDMGPQAFPVREVHKISVLDIRLANADRHAGNILVSKEGEEGRFVLVPIDHGYCLPENFEDCTFEWLYWPQARQPFSSETINYIKALDADQDIALLKFYGWELSLECSRTLLLSTMLLKKGAERGLTPFAIGSILCRETLKKESKIEEIIHEAKNAVLAATSESVFLESISEIMDRHLDELTQ